MIHYDGKREKSFVPEYFFIEKSLFPTDNPVNNDYFRRRKKFTESDGYRIFIYPVSCAKSDNDR